MVTPDRNVTDLLAQTRRGEPHAVQALLEFVYDDLRRFAHALMSREPAGHTLDTTGLVHEAYLRIVGAGDVSWDGRRHFFGAAAIAMRRILVERARRVATQKRSAGRRREPLECVAVIDSTDADAILDLDAALGRLETEDPRKHQVVMLRHFAGLGVEETALALQVSPSTIKNEWSYARAWLAAAIRERSD